MTLSAADGRPAYLYPADEKLREWYIRSMGAVPVSFRPALTATAGLIPISGEEYARRREKLLSGVPHTVYSTGILRFFSLFGGFYADDRGGIRALEDGEVLEGLPCPEGGEPYILGLNGAEPLYWGLTLA